jgi:hypothetical protein
MRQQKVVRTYPKTFTNATTALEKALADGWVVVMANPFDCGNDKKGIEYILQKEAAQNS